MNSPRAVGVKGTRTSDREGTVSSLVDIAGDRPAVVDTTAGPAEVQLGAPTRYLLAGIRLALGWVFLWAFLDKLFGLGHETTVAKSWLNGGSPTKGFLGSSKGPFADFFHSIAGNGVVDVLFMAAMLALGVALMLGIGMRIAAVVGALVTVLMWAAVLPPASNPFMDDHLVYAGVLVALALLGAGNTLGLGRDLDGHAAGAARTLARLITLGGVLRHWPARACPCRVRDMDVTGLSPDIDAGRLVGGRSERLAWPVVGVVRRRHQRRVCGRSWWPVSGRSET